MSEPLPPLLERTAAVLADSARLLLEIEDSIAPLLSRPMQSGTHADAMANFRASVVPLQKIDLLSQTLEDLSFWLDDLAQEVRHHVVGSVVCEAALTRLRLCDLRQRLNGRFDPGAVQTPSDPVLF